MPIGYYSPRFPDRYFVCLANSYKHGGRCIAGVEINGVNDASPKLVNNSPGWIRPIHRQTDGGAIPNEIALGINLFDIVCVRNPVPHPEGAQQENVYFDSLIVVGHTTFHTSLLDKYVTNLRGGLFGNRGKAVVPEEYARLNYSICLIKPSNVSFYLLQRDQLQKPPQPRVRFSFKRTDYNLPVTDPLFIEIIKGDLQHANGQSLFYLTLSLGLEHDNYHSKLAAGVLCPDTGSESFSDELPPPPGIWDMPPEHIFSDYAEIIYELPPLPGVWDMPPEQILPDYGEIINYEIAKTEYSPRRYHYPAPPSIKDDLPSPPSIDDDLPF